MIDINPGVGVWSRKLHDALQPRSHILFEHDADVYKPFLDPLLARPGTILVPKSGMLWENVTNVLTPEFLPHQKPWDFKADGPARRNDTLLVTLNLSFYPRRTYRYFDSVSQLILFQLFKFICSGHLFQRYGLVRMLVWTADQEKDCLLPHTAQGRRRMAFDSELATDWVVELAGLDREADEKGPYFVRDKAIDLASGRRALDQMRQAGMVMPPGRETVLFKTIMAQDGEGAAAVQQGANHKRAFQKKMESIQEQLASGAITQDTKTSIELRKLQYRDNWQRKRDDLAEELLREYYEIVDMYASGTVDSDTVAQRDAEFDHKVRSMDLSGWKRFVLARDNLHLFRQDPPVLSWDRRYAEPLAVRPNEFLPNVPCTLIDIQPKAVHPLLHAMSPGIDPALAREMKAKGGPDLIEYLVREMMTQFSVPVAKALDLGAPGVSRMVLPKCDSLRDPARSGSPVGGVGVLTVRSMNQGQLLEMLEQYFRTLHTPSLLELKYADPVLAGNLFGDEDDDASHGTDA